MENNERILREIVREIKEIMIDCFYSDVKLQDIEKFILDIGEFQSRWYEDDGGMMCEIIDNITGELIGFIRHYRFRMWIEYGDGIEKEVELLQQKLNKLKGVM